MVKPKAKQTSTDFNELPLYQRIYMVVKLIPPGEIATYGQIASVINTGARQVGYAMAAVTDKSVPWQRVINSRGQISLKGEAGLRQRRLLKDEGILFGPDDKLDLTIYQWHGPDHSWCEAHGVVL